MCVQFFRMVSHRRQKHSSRACTGSLSIISEITYALLLPELASRKIVVFLRIEEKEEGAAEKEGRKGKEEAG